jgi:hypothetical protein
MAVWPNKGAPKETASGDCDTEEPTQPFRGPESSDEFPPCYQRKEDSVHNGSYVSEDCG